MFGSRVEKPFLPLCSPGDSRSGRSAAWRLPVPPGTLDKLNYPFGLMRGERRVEYTVADGGRRLEH